MLHQMQSIYEGQGDRYELAKAVGKVVEPQVPVPIQQEIARNMRCEVIEHSSAFAARFLVDQPQGGNTTQFVRGDVLQALRERLFIPGVMCYRSVSDDTKIVGAEVLPRCAYRKTVSNVHHFGAAAAQNNGELWAPIGQQVISQGLDIARQREGQFFSFNCSEQRLDCGNEFVEAAKKLVDDKAVQRQSVGWEILENIGSLRPHLHTIADLQAAGFQVGLDDMPTQQTPVLFGEMVAEGLIPNFIKYDGSVTRWSTSDHDRLRKLTEYLVGTGIRKFVFEGMSELLIYERQLDALRRLQDELRQAATILVQGPVYSGN